ncbi:hypothetical protein CHS0354_025372 [Potamilus streckersoni]|uniref:Intraflagellar transport protein 22 homolog n=1 Tax=Potamilus streckersoni TaxID=2493646 RepID=A0AAE0SPV0_9BIVA|nr:hypothetical protein CHS0354_025372 [Potamilus streckersoni]
MFKVKVLILGPCQSGKTTISNFLADATEISSGEYHPTQGVRILEFEVQKLGGRGRQNGVEVELWDCSGDRRFESCWPGMAKDAGGIVFVYNPDQPNHDKELEHLYNFFISQQGIKESQCCVFSHHRPHTGDRERSQLGDQFANIPCVRTNIEEDGESVREEFNNFLSKLSLELSDKRDQEELSIMNQR